MTDYNGINVDKLRKVEDFSNNILEIIKYTIFRILFPNDRSKLPLLDGKRMLIVGNGPSADNICYEKVKDNNIEILCVNYFASKNELFFKIKPKYYCIIDPLFFNNTNTNTNTDSEIHQLIDVFNNVDWEMTLVCLQYQKFPNLQNPNIKQIHINSNQYHGKWMRYEFYSKNKANFGLQNVVLGAIYFCLTSGIKELYLSGVDNDWHRELIVDEINDVYRESRHFYGLKKVNLTATGMLNKGEFYKYIGYYYITMKQYYYASLYARHLNASVYNLTMTSYIDVFDKKDKYHLMK